MGTDSESSSLRLLRELAARQGVAPTDEDLRAMAAFLATLLPELERIERALPREAAP